MTSDTSPRPVSPLRARMIEDMTVRGFNEHTRSHYIRHVRSFAAFIGRSPDADRDRAARFAEPGELHPEPLTDPDLILSHHPARATVRRLPPSVACQVPPVAG